MKRQNVIFDALEEGMDGMDAVIEGYDLLNQSEKEEMREYFNTVTNDNELGTSLFDKDYSWEDFKAKLNALDDEGQAKFANAI